MFRACYILFFSYFCASCSPVEWLVDRAGYHDDSLPEELTEYVIQHKTGIEVDLTPRSPE